MVVIAISGMSGCGSSTTAKLLARRLKLRHFSPGDYFKKLARKVSRENKSEGTVKFWLTPKGSSKGLHNSIDRMTEKIARRGNVVIDGKLAATMLRKEADLTVWLKASVHVRAKRYAQRDNASLKESLAVLKKKEFLERRNWKRIYGFDYFTQEKKADVVIDNGSKKPEETLDAILSKLRRVFIVHRWEGSPHADWYASTRRDLERKGFIVDVLKMPSPDSPHISKWLPHLASAIGTPNENTYLIGHSAGVMTILRYLEGLKKGEKIGGCVLVAGWVDNLGYRELSNFVDKPINWREIRKHCRKFVAIHSSNDPFVKMYHAETFKRKLSASLVIEHMKCHMTDEEGIKKLPSVVKAIERMKK